MTSSVPAQDKPGLLWIPITSMILGILSFLSLLDDSVWDTETILGNIAISSLSFVLGAISLITQKAGKGMAITGVTLSSLSFLSCLGMLV